MVIPYSWIVIAVLSLVLLLSFYVISKLISANGRLKSEKRGTEVRRGFLIEQLLPFAQSYPWDPQTFKFLGNPIDGIHFEEDEIVLVEFKSGNSRLSEGQKKVKELVSSGKVRFSEVRAKMDDGELTDIVIR